MVSIPRTSGKNITDLLYCRFLRAACATATGIYFNHFTGNDHCNTQYLTQHFNTALTSPFLLQPLHDIPRLNLPLLLSFTFSLIVLLYKQRMLCFLHL